METWAFLETSAIVQLLKNFSGILLNRKLNYRVHKSPPPVPILSQTNPVRTSPFYLSKIHPNIIHPPTSWPS
jgi:hypothetical protein